jgi:hypothetical protein
VAAPPGAGDMIHRGHARALLHGLTLAGLLFTAYLFVFEAPRVGTFGYDAWAYWSASLPHPYTVPLGGLGSFPYSPPMVLLFDLLGLMPWWVFLYVWACLGIATIIWLGGRWSVFLFAFPPVALELYHGNIHFLLAAAIALGFRYPASWAFVLLTKPTAGVGLLWFVVRQEWRPLIISVAIAGGAVLASLVIAPSIWPEWIAYMAADADGTPGGPSVPVPLPIRLAIAAVIVIWGARTDRPWTVAVASTIALPVLWFAGLSVLLGAVPGLRRRGEGHRVSPRVLGSTPVPAYAASHASSQT